MKVALLGLGNVSLALLQHLSSSSSLSEKYQLVGAADSTGTVVYPGIAPSELFLAKKEKRLSGLKGYSPRRGIIEMIVESRAEMVIDSLPSNYPDGEPTLSLLRFCLSKGIHAVVASKAALAQKMGELRKIAMENGAALRYSAAVGGGLPFLEVGFTCMSSGVEKVLAIRGLLNGTSNYIMGCIAKGVGFEEALKEARETGIAEADADSDLKGRDASAKIVIVANAVAGCDITLNDVRNECDVEAARRLAERGFNVKQICRYSNGEASVSYEVLREDDPLNVSGTDNALLYSFQIAGDVLLRGRGAGGRETALAVLRDMNHIAATL